MTNIFSMLTGFDGTVSRQDFWTGVLVLVCVGAIGAFVPVLGSVASLALLYPWTCLAMKRLRHMNRPVGIVLVPLGLCAAAVILGLVVAIGARTPALYAAAFVAGGLALIVGSLATLVAISFLLWIGLTPGDGDCGSPPRR